MKLQWDSPDAPVRAVVIVVHGFARSPQRMSGVAGLLVERGCRTVRPAIPSFALRRSLHDENWLDDVGQHIAGHVRENAAGVPLIGVGHSAGAAIVAGWASLLDGMVLLDPVDRHRRIARLAAAGSLPPLRVITADPSACNRHGRSARLLAAAGGIEPGRTWAQIKGSSHADPERVPASLRADDVPAVDPVARLACGPGGSPVIVCRWGTRIAHDVADLITRR